MTNTTFAATYVQKALPIGRQATVLAAVVLVSLIAFAPVSYAVVPAAPMAETWPARSIDSNSAALAGIITRNGSPTTFWFEYGATPSLGSQTPHASAGNYLQPIVSAPVSGLAPQTTYYARIIAENSYGRAQGNAVSFVTTAAPAAPAGNTGSSGQGNSNATTTANTPQTLVQRVFGGSRAPATVVVGIGGETAAIKNGQTKNVDLLPGEEIVVTFSYRNDMAVAVKDAKVHIAVPDRLEVTNVSPAPSATSTLSIEVPIGTIEPNELGSVVVTLRTTPNARPGDIFSITATLSYTDAGNKTQTASAGITVPVIAERPDPRRLLGLFLATAQGGGIIFWMLVLILVLQAVTLAYIISKERERKGKKLLGISKLGAKTPTETPAAAAPGGGGHYGNYQGEAKKSESASVEEGKSEEKKTGETGNIAARILDRLPSRSQRPGGSRFPGSRGSAPNVPTGNGLPNGIEEGGEG